MFDNNENNDVEIFAIYALLIDLKKKKRELSLITGGNF